MAGLRAEKRKGKRREPHDGEPGPERTRLPDATARPTAPEGIYRMRVERKRWWNWPWSPGVVTAVMAAILVGVCALSVFAPVALAPVAIALAIDDLLRWERAKQEEAKAKEHQRRLEEDRRRTP